MPSIVRVWDSIKGCGIEWVTGQRDNLPIDFDPYTSSHLGPSSQSLVIFQHQNTSVREIRKTIPWKKAIALAIDATTEVSMDTRKVTATDAEVGFIFRDNDSPPFNTTIWTLMRRNVVQQPLSEVPYQENFDEVINNNTIKFLQRCIETQRRFGGGVFLGELRETIRMITRPAKAIRRALDGHVFDTRRRLSRISGGEYRNGQWVGDRSSARRAKDVISNGWLQLQFGIKPLVNDLDDGMRATAEYFNYVPRERVSFTSGGDASTFVDQNESLDLLRFKYRTIRKSSLKVTTRGAIRLDGPNKTNPAFIKHFGLTWQDAVLTGWEIIPYSFVIDYFTNIGDFLEASMFPVAELSWCNRSKKLTHTTEKMILRDSLATTLVAIDDPRVEVVWEGNPNLLYTRRVLSRERDPVLVPQLALKVPGIDSLKWLNLSALVATRFN